VTKIVNIFIFINYVTLIGNNNYSKVGEFDSKYINIINTK